MPGPPINVKATSVDESEEYSINLIWSPPVNPNGVLLEYQIFYFGYKEEETAHVGTIPLIHINPPYYKTLVPILAGRSVSVNTGWP